MTRFKVILVLQPYELLLLIVQILSNVLQILHLASGLTELFGRFPFLNVRILDFTQFYPPHPLTRVTHSLLGRVRVRAMKRLLPGGLLLAWGCAGAFPLLIGRGDRSLRVLSALPAGGEQNDAGLYKVTPVPTYEEMLAWADCMDGQMSASAHKEQEERDASIVEELMLSLSSLQNMLDSAEPSLEGSDAERINVAMSRMRETIERVAAEECEIEEKLARQNGDLRQDEGPGSYSIYGSREARDKIYLYVWSLLQRRCRRSQ
jgi:hypothetical protein